MIVRDISFRHVVASSIILRVILVLYSEWYDKRAVVKYTDVDYRVFTDAARFLMKPSFVETGKPANIAKGPLGRWLTIGDPYTCDTYRYTPLLALLLTPNIWLHPTFGKFLFSACDILVGVLLYKLLLTAVFPKASTLSDGGRERWATFYSALHLLNPMVFSISTRGSSESTLGALVIATLYFAMKQSKRRWDATAVMLGVSAHWKVYPIIYGISLVAVIASERGAAGKGEEGVIRWLKSLVNPQCLRFVLLSAGTFMALNSVIYLIWGYPFLYETYLYHVHRLDPAHNFSPYWLPIQLSDPAYAHIHTGAPVFGHKFAQSPFASFVPQMILSLGTGLTFGRAGAKHLPFTWFVQTAVFVTLNKVCTSQYFLWYLTILPLVLPSLSFTRGKAIILISSWVAAQALWLKFAYDLEFLGQKVHYRVWACSILFLLVNCWEIVEIIRAYRWNTLFSSNRTKKEI